MAKQAAFVGTYESIHTEADSPWKKLDIQEKLDAIQNYTVRQQVILLLSEARIQSPSYINNKIGTMDRYPVMKEWLLRCAGLDPEKDRFSTPVLEQRALMIAQSTTQGSGRAEYREASILERLQAIGDGNSTSSTRTVSEQAKLERDLLRITVMNTLRIHDVSTKRLIDSGMKKSTACAYLNEQVLLEEDKGTNVTSMNDVLCHLPLSIGKRLARWYLDTLQKKGTAFGIDIEPNAIREEIDQGKKRCRRSTVDMLYRTAGEPTDMAVLEDEMATLLEEMGLTETKLTASGLAKKIWEGRQISGMRQTSIDSHY